MISCIAYHSSMGCDGYGLFAHTKLAASCHGYARIGLLAPLPRVHPFAYKIIRASANTRRGSKNSLKVTTKSIETLKRSLEMSPDVSAPSPAVAENAQLQEEDKSRMSSVFPQKRISAAPQTSKTDLTTTQAPALLLLLRRMNRNMLRKLASFRLAFTELGLIAALCALGTLIEQDKSEQFYLQRYSEDLAFGFLNGEWVLRLCLDHVYTAPYFLSLLGLLAASLMACTATRQVPVVKIARRWSFYSAARPILRLPFHEILPRARLDDLGAILVGKNYQVFVQGHSLYAFKGMAGRFAPIGVHAALLLIMGGATFSALGGYRGSVMVPQGLNFVAGDVMYPQGFLSRPLSSFDTEVHVNKFSIETYTNGQVSQFHSDLSLFDTRGREVSRKLIGVNDPLRYGGFTMYQTDWGISTIQVHADGKGPFNLAAAPLQTGDNKLFGTFFPLGENGLSERKGISMLARDLQSVVIYDSTGEFVGVRRPGSDRPIKVDGIEIVIDDVIGSTGLELKLDPGVPMVYAGFGALMLTTVLSYLSHTQVWALEEGTSIVMGGKSNRRRAEFKSELDNIMDLVPEVVKTCTPKEETTSSCAN